MSDKISFGSNTSIASMSCCEDWDDHIPTVKYRCSTRIIFAASSKDGSWETPDFAESKILLEKIEPLREMTITYKIPPTTINYVVKHEKRSKLDCGPVMKECKPEISGWYQG
jgi:hypothetical protein